MQLNTEQKCVKRVRPAKGSNISATVEPRMPTYSKVIPDMTSPATTGRHLSNFEKRLKMPPPTALGRISPERFSEDHKIVHISAAVSLIYLQDMTWLAASGWLQSAIEYCV